MVIRSLYAECRFMANCDVAGFGEIVMVCGTDEGVVDDFTNLTLLIDDSIRLEGLFASNVKDTINRSSGLITLLDFGDRNSFRLS